MKPRPLKFSEVLHRTPTAVCARHARSKRSRAALLATVTDWDALPAVPVRHGGKVAPGT